MHQRASLACMLAEAKYLNRTAIIQDDYCMDRAHTRAKHAQTFINISNIYNVPEIQKEVRLLLRSGTESVEKLVQHDLSRHNYQPGKLTQSKVTSSIKTAVLESDPSLIITREFRRDYWYELCSSTPKENPEITKTRAHKSVYSKVKMIPTRLTTIAKKIVDSIGERFSYIHVRRGDKIRNSKRWPNLMHDTRGDVILKNPTVKAKIPETNAIYIATNEDDLSVFSAIFHNRKAFAMANYSQSIPEIASLSVYEANLVDLGVRDFADKGIIETFYHLTCDDKHGIASPRSCEVSRHE